MRYSIPSVCAFQKSIYHKARFFEGTYMKTCFLRGMHAIESMYVYIFHIRERVLLGYSRMHAYSKQILVVIWIFAGCYLDIFQSVCALYLSKPVCVFLRATVTLFLLLNVNDF